MTAPIHPNGFRIRLLATVFGFRLRLHTWPPGVTRVESPHDHRSWFISIPLWGRFIETRYAEQGGDEWFEILRCHSTTGNGKPTTTVEGLGTLTEISRHVRRALVPYVCPRGAIHAFGPIEKGFAASLVLFGRPKIIPRAWVRP